MKDRRYLCVLAGAALLAAAPVLAHDLPLEVLTYVKAEAGRLRVLVRVPPEFLRDAGLPVRSDGYLDRQALEVRNGPLTAVVSDIARTLDVMSAGQPLTVSETSWRISQRPDASFNTYEDAAARFAAPPLPVEVRMDPAAALVDVQLDYPIASAGEGFSIRVNGFRASRPSRMQVRYVTTTGDTRVLITTGAARRVELEPRWQATARMFATLGVEQLTEAALPLLFLLSLAIPLRPGRTTLSVFGAFAMGWVVALTIATQVPGSPDEPLGDVFQSLAAAVLVVAAVQNITGSRGVWVQVAAIAFGLAVGVAQGLANRANLLLAGEHTVLALLAFGGPILLGWAWLLLVAQPIVGLVHRVTPGPSGSALPSGPTSTPDTAGGGFPAGVGPWRRWAIVLLSALVIHAALHGILVGR